MGKEDKVTLEACKAMCSRGEWPPLMVTHDSRQGYSSSPLYVYD
jgi:predicted lipoprotein with Yx(FWY)xxD motif